MIPPGRVASLQGPPAEVLGSSLPWTHVRDSVCLAKCQHLVLKARWMGRNPPSAWGIAKRHVNPLGERVRMDTGWLWKQMLGGTIANVGWHLYAKGLRQWSHSSEEGIWWSCLNIAPSNPASPSPVAWRTLHRRPCAGETSQWRRCS